MRFILFFVVVSAFVSVTFAADVPYERVIEKEGTYSLELAGMGFAFDDAVPDSLETKPLTFLIRVFSKVHKPQDSVPTQLEVSLEPSLIRLEYYSYPLEVVESSYNFFEADIYSRKVDDRGRITNGEKLGKITLTLTDYTGLYGGKGKLTIGKKNYSVFFYRKEAIEGFARWMKELE